MHNYNRPVDLIDVDRLIRRAFESATTTAPETLRKWHQAEVTAAARAKKEASKGECDEMERRMREAEGHVHARIDEAVEAEREACAKLCESEWSTEDERKAGQIFAREIRALNKTGKGHES